MKTYNDPRLLHGGDYNPEQWLDHPEVLKRDFELMDKAHINTVTVGVFSWSTLEPEEGRYQFDWLDHVFKEMNKRNGRVILATPSGGRPQWLSEKYPEVNRTNPYGQKHHHGFRHNHCYTSPIYRKKVKKINTLLAKRYGNDPALLMWHISNEYSGECYCELCSQKWREWVQEKYRTLEAVNKAWWLAFWSNHYSNWSQVVPPSPLGEHKVHGMDLDWKRFVTDQTIDFFLHEIEPIRRITPKIPVTTNFMAEGHDQQDFIPLEGIDYSRFAKVVDIVSWDSYPDWHNPYEPLHVTAMKSAYVHDQYRSLKKQPFLVMESTPSMVYWHAYNKAKKPGMHILSSFQQIAHGSDSTLYFQWRQSLGNSEKFHGAVIGHDDNEENRVFQEVATYGQRLALLSAVKGTTTQAKVAILFDWESNWALKRGGGYGRPTRQYIQTLQAHYQIFWEADISVDILTPKQDFSGYSLVIAPMLYLIDDETLSTLYSYVNNGGTLIASYFTGMVDSNDKLHFGGWPQKLQNIFGLYPKELDMLCPKEQNQIDYCGKKFFTKDYCTVIQVTTGKVIGSYHKAFYAGTPALVENQLGKGKAYYLASRTDNDFLQIFYQTLIEKLELQQGITDTPNPLVSIQSRTKEEAHFYFLMNFSKENQTVSLNTKLVDLETDQFVHNKLRFNPYEVKILKK